jgi:hypothetical protein
MRNPKKKGGKKSKDAGPSLMAMDAEGPAAAAAAAAGAGDTPAVSTSDVGCICCQRRFLAFLSIV